MSDEKPNTNTNFRTQIADALSSSQYEPLLKILGKEKFISILERQMITQLRCQALKALEPFKQLLKGEPLEKHLHTYFPELF